MFCSWGFATLTSLVITVSVLPSQPYTIQAGDTLWKLFHDTAKAEFVARLNGLEPTALVLNRTIDIPTDWSACQDFAPFVNYLPEYETVARFTYVDVASQYLGTYEHGRLTWWCRISPGTDERPTPTGTYCVRWKDIDHVSNLYFDDKGNGLPMHYGVNIGGEFWIHEGWLPGYPASHGCIRLRPTDAKHFYAWVRPGTTVMVSTVPPSAG